MKKSEINTMMYTEYNEQFLIPAALLFILLVTDLLLANRKSNLLRRIGIIGKESKKERI
jgi:hypothetical protein